MAKQRLVEKVIIPARFIEKIDIPLKEAVVGDKTYEILAVYRFPFTRPGQKNLNGRTYKHDLWERLFKLNITTVSLVDHPENEGDPARIWAVMKNAGFNKEKTLGLVDCYVINNEYGKTAMGVLAAGADLGLSSSGIGDFEIDGETVVSESFELERWADWVMSPSYSVFGRIDDKISEANMAEPIKDKITETNALENKVQESIGGTDVKSLTLREKREFEASLKRIYEDVKDIKSIKERLERAKEALTFYEDTDVDSYKKKFEDLVKETEKEFEETLAKGEQADATKKEAEDAKKESEDTKKESEELKKENETLKKENDNLKKKVEESLFLKNESDGYLTSMAESTRRKIPYEKYEELRQYAIKATKLYSSMKTDRNILQIKIQEMKNELRAIKESEIIQYQKDAKARARVEELKERNAQAKILSDQRLKEAQEAEVLRKVNPDVLEYYNDCVNRLGESVVGLRTQILSKRTLDEAQLFVLKSLRKPVINESVRMRDISVPLPVNNCKQVMPDFQMTMPKGFI